MFKKKEVCINEFLSLEQIDQLLFTLKEFSKDAKTVLKEKDSKI